MPGSFAALHFRLFCRYDFFVVVMIFFVDAIVFVFGTVVLNFVEAPNKFGG